MKKLLCLLTLTGLFAFTPAGEKQFSQSGVSFTVPDSWNVTEQEDLEGKGYYLSCEKEGADASGLVTVTWINDSLDLEQMASSYAEELNKNYILKEANPKMSPVKAITFNKRPGKGIDYTLSLLGVDHRGRISCFYGPGKTVTVLTQEANEDIAENKAGFDRIISTFNVR